MLFIWYHWWFSNLKMTRQLGQWLVEFRDLRLTLKERNLMNCHYADVIMIEMASQITSLTVVYSIINSGADQSKHQSSASLAFVRGFHRWPVNSPHKGPVTRKMFPFDDVIMFRENTKMYLHIISFSKIYEMTEVAQILLQRWHRAVAIILTWFGGIWYPHG